MVYRERQMGERGANASMAEMCIRCGRHGYIDARTDREVQLTQESVEESRPSSTTWIPPHGNDFVCSTSLLRLFSAK